MDKKAERLKELAKCKEKVKFLLKKWILEYSLYNNLEEVIKVLIIQKPEKTDSFLEMNITKFTIYNLLSSNLANLRKEGGMEGLMADGPMLSVLVDIVRNIRNENKKLPVLTKEDLTEVAANLMLTLRIMDMLGTLRKGLLKEASVKLDKYFSLSSCKKNEQLHMHNIKSRNFLQCLIKNSEKRETYFNNKYAGDVEHLHSKVQQELSEMVDKVDIVPEELNFHRILFSEDPNAIRDWILSFFSQETKDKPQENQNSLIGLYRTIEDTKNLHGLNVYIFPQYFMDFMNMFCDKDIQENVVSSSMSPEFSDEPCSSKQSATSPKKDSPKTNDYKKEEIKKPDIKLAEQFGYFDGMTDYTIYA